MGLFDKAADKFKRSGEETIRMVDYDALPEDEEVAGSGLPQRDRKPKIERAPRPKLADLLPQRKGKDLAPLDDDSLDELSDERYPIIEDTAFAIDDDEPNFYEEQQAGWEADEARRKPAMEPQDKNSRWSKRKKEELTPEDEQKIADVLEVLNIPATFSIPSDMLMPSDFEDIDFDLQMPQGYDIGQVEFFVERSESSAREYLRLLELRNEHIALLATTIDRLQVDLQNLKYDSQIAAGIGIMPTSDNDELERENMELRVKIKRLEGELKERESEPVLTSEERTLYEHLRDENSMLQREKEDLEEQVLTLKTKLAQIEENADDDDWPVGNTSQNDDFELPAVLPDSPMVKRPQSGASLPDLSPSTSVDKTINESDESSVEQPMSLSSQLDDDDDELDKLMKDWSN